METDLNFDVRSQTELLSVALGVTVDDAKEILEECGSVWNIPKRMDIAQRRGIPLSKINQLAAGLILSKKDDLSEDERPVLISPEDTASYFSDLRVLAHEELWVAYLDLDCKVLRRERMSRGDEVSATVPFRVIARNAIMCGAHSVVLCHNHPSGVSESSMPDQAITDELSRLMRSIHIHLVDHVILANGEHTSMAEEGTMPTPPQDPLFGFGAPDMGPPPEPLNLDPIPEDL